VSRTRARQISRRSAATGFHVPPNSANQYSIIDDVHAYMRRRIHVFLQILAKKKKTNKIQILAARRKCFALASAFTFRFSSLGLVMHMVAVASNVLVVVAS